MGAIWANPFFLKIKSRWNYNCSALAICVFPLMSSLAHTIFPSSKMSKIKNPISIVPEHSRLPNFEP